RRAARAAPRPAPPPPGRQPRLDHVRHVVPHCPADEEDFHMPVLDRKELEESPLSDLHAIASELGIEGYRRLRRDELIDALAGDSGGSAESGGSRASRGAAKDDEPKPRSRSRSRSRARKTDDPKPPARAKKNE